MKTQMDRKANPKALSGLLAPEGTYDNASAKDITCPVKFFCPWNDWAWYAAEYDAATGIAWGIVHGFETEVGSFSIDELNSISGPFGMRIEMDEYWTPMTMADIRTASENGNRP